MRRYNLHRGVMIERAQLPVTDRWLPCKKRGTYFLTGDDVFAMRYYFNEGWTRYLCAKNFGVSFRTADRVVKRIGRYKHM